MAPFRVLVLFSAACLIVGCTSGESARTPATAVEPATTGPGSIVDADPPAPTPNDPSFGPAIGGPLPELEVAPGRYASKFHYAQDKLITREHTVANSRSGTVELWLDPDGSARLCRVLLDRSRSHVSRYASRDSQDQVSEHEDEIALALRGRWASAGSRTTVSFDRLAYRRCEISADEPTNTEAIELSCFTTPNNAKLPRAALICAVAADDRPLGEAALLLADSYRAGAWALRHDPTGPDAPLPETALPYLVLGVDPGLEIISDEDRHEGPTLRFAAVNVASPRANSE